MLPGPTMVGGPSVGDPMPFFDPGKTQGYHGVGGSMALLELPAKQSLNTK